MMVPSVGDLVLVLFYNEGMRRLFYLGSCRSVRQTPFGLRISLLRKKDRSSFSFLSSSPSVVGFKIIRKFRY
jgi:hypothetical protein